MKKLSLHVGLNSVDPDQYAGWSGLLDGCENDAKSMQQICKTQKFDNTQLILTKLATAKTVLDAITAISTQLKAGDLFVFSSSSHGGQVDNPWHQYEQISTICMYDREIISHELYACWSKFKPDVSIVFFSDSCHSGTIARVGAQISKSRVRVMPTSTQVWVHNEHKDRIKELTKTIPPKPKAGVIQLGGCQDNQLSSDGNVNGLFTEHVLKVWDNGMFQGDYPKFYRSIVKQMPAFQTPSYLELGHVTDKFKHARPF